MSLTSSAANQTPPSGRSASSHSARPPVGSISVPHASVTGRIRGAVLDGRWSALAASLRSGRLDAHRAQAVQLAARRLSQRAIVDHAARPAAGLRQRLRRGGARAPAARRSARSVRRSAEAARARRLSAASSDAARSGVCGAFSDVSQGSTCVNLAGRTRDCEGSGRRATRTTSDRLKLRDRGALSRRAWAARWIAALVVVAAVAGAVRAVAARGAQRIAEHRHGRSARAADRAARRRRRHVQPGGRARQSRAGQLLGHLVRAVQVRNARVCSSWRTSCRTSRSACTRSTCRRTRRRSSSSNSSTA